MYNHAAHVEISMGDPLRNYWSPETAATSWTRHHRQLGLDELTLGDILTLRRLYFRF